MHQPRLHAHRSACGAANPGNCRAHVPKFSEWAFIAQVGLNIWHNTSRTDAKSPPRNSFPSRVTVRCRYAGRNSVNQSNKANTERLITSVSRMTQPKGYGSGPGSTGVACGESNHLIQQVTASPTSASPKAAHSHILPDGRARLVVTAAVRWIVTTASMPGSMTGT